MEFPSAADLDDILDSVTYPQFVDVQYEPPAPTISDLDATSRLAMGELPLEEVPHGGTVAVGLGSRGIRDAPVVAKVVLAELRERGYEPVVVPAMGSHGGASAAGQTETLESLGLGSDRLACPVDARMETEVVGETVHGDPVHVAKAALVADAVVVLNRVKPHTNFQGDVESGICKMATIGLGKRAGAAAVHSAAIEYGYVPAITDALAVIKETIPFLGGIVIVENVEERAAVVEGIPATDLPEAEAILLERARELMATLPYDELDLLVVDEIGKDISGTGMDTNVIGRSRVIGGSAPKSPTIDRIVVRGLTEATHGNGHGIGLADLTTTDVIEKLDLGAMYTNALTSGSLQRDSLPLAMPTEELAIRAAVRTTGRYDPRTTRIAWIRNTLDLSTFRVSEALAEQDHDHVTVGDRYELSFEGGIPSFVPAADDDAPQ